MHLQRILLTTGEFRKPLIAWKMPPPMAPMVKAPPQSSTILQGLERKIELKILNPIMLNRVSGMDPALRHWYNWGEERACLYCLTSSSLSRQQQKNKNITAKQTQPLPQSPSPLPWTGKHQIYRNAWTHTRQRDILPSWKIPAEFQFHSAYIV